MQVRFTNLSVFGFVTMEKESRVRLQKFICFVTQKATQFLKSFFDFICTHILKIRVTQS